MRSAAGHRADRTIRGTARDVAEEVGPSSTATDTMRNPITLHHGPRVTLAHGPVAYLLSAGAGFDVVGLHSWQRGGGTASPAGFKGEFASVVRAEATRMPRGRVQFLRRYGASDPAIGARLTAADLPLC